MNFHHRFTVHAPLADVREFHSQAASMGAITPPPVIVRIHSAPETLQEGDSMDFTMWLGPLPVHWVAQIEEVTPASFVDRMVKGPFTKWIHKHTFIALDEHTTEVQDQVEVELSRHPFWKMVGGFMWLNLPVLFAFRKFKTKWLLEKQISSQKAASGVTES